MGDDSPNTVYMAAKKPTTDRILTTPPPALAVDYQKLFESLPDRYIAFLTDDPNFTIAAESESHAEVAMVKRAETIGRPLFDVFPDTSPKYRTTGVSDLIESLRKVIRTKKPDTMEALHYDLPRPDGTMATRYWQVTHYPVFDDKAKVALVFQSTHDKTDEVLTGDKLKRTQQQLDEAMSIGMIGTWLWDIANNKVSGDINMAAMFGVDPAEAAKGLPLSAFVAAMHPDDQSRVKAEIAAATKADDLFHSEYRTLGQDNSVRWLIARGRIERDAQAKAVSFPGVLVDITERKLIENNLSYLAKASAVLSASLDYKKTLQTIAKLMVPDIADWCTVDILDDDGALQQVALAHKDPAKIKWARELRRQQGPPDLDEPGGSGEVIRTGKPLFYPYITDEMIVAAAKSKEELKLLRDLGLVSAITVPLKINNKTVGVISLVMNEQKRHFTQSDLEMAEELASRASLAMTNASLYSEARAELAERTRLEEALRVANDELEDRVEARTRELEQANLTLERSNQELQDFAYVASHDLQEPLRKIQAFGNLLQSEYAKELGEGADYLDRMRNAAARMSALIEDILSFSRVTTKGRGFTPVNLRTVVQEVIGDLEVRISDTKATIEIGDLPTVHADAMQMRQLMQNLIANAIKFHRDGVPPVIKIRSSVETAADDKIKYCRLEIQDNGLGFDEKYLDRIFAVFQRLHNRESFEGTGIGLAVCRKIVERHGGTITATSKQDQGSTFIITLPMRHKKGEQLV